MIASRLTFFAFCAFTAATITGIDKLLETLALTAELNEYQTAHDIEADGVCLEAFRDEGRGPIAWMIVDSKTSAKHLTYYHRDDVVTLHVVHGSHPCATAEKAFALKGVPVNAPASVSTPKPKRVYHTKYKATVIVQSTSKQLTPDQVLGALALVFPGVEPPNKLARPDDLDRLVDDRDLVRRAFGAHLPTPPARVRAVGESKPTVR